VIAGLGRWQVAAVACSLALSLLYWRVTPPALRSHDAGGHVQHVGRIGGGDLVPAVESCWQCHHPPLYYLVAATALGFPAEPSPRDERLLLAVALHAVFLLAGARALGELVGCTRRRDLATWLLCLWPAGIVHSVRIGNDALSYVWFALAFLALARWLVRDDARALVAACACAVLGAFTKANAAVIGGSIVLLVAARAAWRRRLERREARAIAVLGGGFLAAAALLAWKGDQWDRLSVNSDVLRVGAAPGNFLCLDLRSFVTHPFTSPFLDAAGRQCFWNYLLKTALFGEFDYRDPALVGLGAALNAGFVAVLALAAVGGSRLWRRRQPGHLALLLVPLGLAAAALLAMRISFPSVTAGDFRYAHPVVIPLVALWAEAARKEDQVAMRRLHAAVAVVFAAASIAFFARVSALPPGP
jgi:hypothetical protein